MGADTSGATSPHLVLLVRHALYLRNYESMVRQLAAQDWRITIATLTGSRLVDEGLANALVAEYPGITRAELPRARGVIQDGLEAAYTTLDWLRYFDARYEGSPALEERAKRRVCRPLKALLKMYRVRTNTRRRLSAQTRLMRLTGPSRPSSLALKSLAALKPTVMAVTPLVDIDGGQQAYVDAAARLGIPSALLVASWDNLTNKGLIHRIPDRVVVWNELQADEAFRLHGVPRDRITTTGAQLFDWLRTTDPIPERTAFLQSLGLDPNKRTILYVGSSSAVGARESRFLLEQYIPYLRGYWDKTVAQSNLVVRYHPTNPIKGSWIREVFTQYSAKADPLAGQPVVDDRTRRHYRALLTHADVVVGINTSAFLEAAVVGTPAIPIASRRLRTSQQSAPHFRLLESAGLFDEPRSIYGNLNAIGDVLADATHTQARLDDFVHNFIDPPDGSVSATDALTEAIEAAEAKSASTPALSRRSFSLALIVLFILGLLRKADRTASRLARRAGGLVHRVKTLSMPKAAPMVAPSSDSVPAERPRLTAKQRAKAKKTHHRRKTVLAFKIDTYRVIWGPNRYGSARRMLRRVNKLLRARIRRVPGVARPTGTASTGAQRSAFASAFYQNVTRPALARRDTRAADIRMRELETSLVNAAALGKPIVFGPWTSEVGFELLYWIPYVKTLVERTAIDPGQITIISRGGTSGWYGLPGANYRDVFEILGPSEFHDRIGNTNTGKKQTRWSPIEHELVDQLAPRDAFIVHPREMYETLMPFFVGRANLAWLDRLVSTQTATMTHPSVGSDDRQDEVTARLPSQYIAVGLYHRPSLTADIRDARIRAIVDGAKRMGLPLVSLETGLILDDHRALDLSTVWMSRPLLGIDAQNNLEMQTRVLAGAQGFVCTYGGLSYLGAALGVPTVSLFDDEQRILWHHLEVAHRRFSRLGVVYEVSDISNLNPTLLIDSFTANSNSTSAKGEVA
ncbi:MAG: hypothetical protein Q7L55_10235 [Actinomycetota bacterium]|nr:hypothetical protein [Actinomycetota bacterium]